MMTMEIFCTCIEVERRQRYINHLEQQLDADHDLIKLVKQCLHGSPRMRPTVDNVIGVLKNLYLQLILALFGDHLYGHMHDTYSSSY